MVVTSVGMKYHFERLSPSSTKLIFCMAPIQRRTTCFETSWRVMHTNIWAHGETQYAARRVFQYSIGAVYRICTVGVSAR
jgi:hypothetical protein